MFFLNIKRIFKKPLRVVTHNGKFHADDVFACAAVSLWAEKRGLPVKVARTRDWSMIEKADIVFDVGGIYDECKMRFDHHQKGGAGKRENGIPYAAFGLVWKKIGEDLSGNIEIARKVDSFLGSSIDAADNGIILSDIAKFGFREYCLEDIVENMFNKMKPQQEADRAFGNAVNFAKTLLYFEINEAKRKFVDTVEVRKMIRVQNSPNILILDKHCYWAEAASEDKSVKVVVYPRSYDNEYSIQTACDNVYDYNSQRFEAPQEWWGLMTNDLEKASGVVGAVFCSNKGWFCVAKTKEAAIELAKRALQATTSSVE